MYEEPDKHYLKVRNRLKRYWFKAQSVYSYLTPNEQWQLHDFYRPSEDLSEEQLIAHRAKITAARPSLPHQAVRALEKLDAAAANWAVKAVRPREPAPAPARRKGRGQREHNLVIRSVVRPKIDTAKLSQAIILLARELAAAEDPAVAAARGRERLRTKRGITLSDKTSSRSSAAAGCPDEADEPAPS